MMRRRAGMGLVEVMLAIAIATALVSVLAVTIQRMFAANATAREHSHTMNSLGHLGAQFRRDVHAALATSPESAAEPAQKLTFKAADSSEVQYEIVPAGIQRRHFAGGQLRAQELFLIQGMKPVGWRVDQEHREVVLTIGRLARPSANDETLSGQFAIRAAQRAMADPSQP